MPESFSEGLENKGEYSGASKEVFEEIVNKANSKTLIKLGFLERERIARHIVDLYVENKEDQDIVCSNIDRYDDIYRLRPISIPGDDGDLPNYRSPITTVTLEVIHANIMNVFFTPKDPMRVIPTEANDIPKIKKLDIFGNWSMKNEMKLFEGIDRLFHASAKNGETPYMVYWVKEYGTDLKIEPVIDPNTGKEMLDDVTGEVITGEREVNKLLYSGPKLEIFSRKDYIYPKNSVMDKPPEWEMRRVPLTSDTVLTRENEGRYYDGTHRDIGGWGGGTSDPEYDAVDKDGDKKNLQKTEKMFIEFYGKLRVNAIKEDDQSEDQYEEISDEFIAVVEIQSETLCELRKNKFPMKKRPIGLDVFIPDDEGGRSGTGVVELMESIQSAYDKLHNQYLFGCVQANNPFGFFSPTGNMKSEPIKARSGYLYPTADPNSINMVKIPAPDQSLLTMMEVVRNQSQVLFGIGDYQSGIESSIDPSAPAKKAELVVAQGNVRMNMIIKRKNKTLQDIFTRWFLLYQANMPPNKFMRVAGDGTDTPWQFNKIDISDFQLNSIPDFELTGNVLNSNKALEAQKAVGVYNLLVPNPFFSPQTAQGLQALHALTKWFIDKLDETGVSAFLPSLPGTNVHTPEEENALMLQGDKGKPTEGEEHMKHIKSHAEFLQTAGLPDDVKQEVFNHIKDTAEMMKMDMVKRVAMSQQPQGGVQNGTNTNRPGQGGTLAPVFQEPGMGGAEGGFATGV